MISVNRNFFLSFTRMFSTPGMFFFVCLKHLSLIMIDTFLVAAYDFRQSKLLPFFTRMFSTPGMFFFVCLKHLSLIMIDTFLLNPYFTTSPVF